MSARSRWLRALVLTAGAAPFVFTAEACSTAVDQGAPASTGGMKSIEVVRSGGSTFVGGAGEGGTALAQGGTSAPASAGSGGTSGGATAVSGAGGSGSPSGGGGAAGSGGAKGSGGRRGVGGTGGRSGAGGNGLAGATAAGGNAGRNGLAGATAAGSGGQGGLPPSMTPYKGVANSPAAELSALGATWCYNWGTTPKATDCNDPYFVPMIWGPDNVAGALAGIAKAGYTTLLGFNEPNKSDQSNISVTDAIALWPELTSNPNIRVGSPAVSDDGRAWLEDFMTQAKNKGLRVDFIAMHWYGWNQGSCTASQLEGAVNWASKWGLPVWVTEWGCMGSSNPDEQTVLDFYGAASKMLAKHPLVERYAWYPWNTYNELYKNGSMTALGKAFAAAPQYRE